MPLKSVYCVVGACSYSFNAMSCSEDEESDDGSEAESGAEGEEEEDGFEKIKSAKEKKKVSSSAPVHPSAQLSHCPLMMWLLSKGYLDGLLCHHGATSPL